MIDRRLVLVRLTQHRRPPIRRQEHRRGHRGVEPPAQRPGRRRPGRRRRGARAARDVLRGAVHERAPSLAFRGCERGSVSSQQMSDDLDPLKRHLLAALANLEPGVELPAPSPDATRGCGAHRSAAGTSTSRPLAPARGRLLHDRLGRARVQRRGRAVAAADRPRAAALPLGAFYPARARSWRARRRPRVLLGVWPARRRADRRRAAQGLRPPRARTSSRRRRRSPRTCRARSGWLRLGRARRLGGRAARGRTTRSSSAASATPRSTTRPRPVASTPRRYARTSSSAADPVRLRGQRPRHQRPTPPAGSSGASGSPAFRFERARRHEPAALLATPRRELAAGTRRSGVRRCSTSHRALHGPCRLRRRDRLPLAAAIQADYARDPLLGTARALVEVDGQRGSLRQRYDYLARGAPRPCPGQRDAAAPALESAEEVMAPLAPRAPGWSPQPPRRGHRSPHPRRPLTLAQTINERSPTSWRTTPGPRLRRGRRGQGRRLRRHPGCGRFGAARSSTPCSTSRPSSAGARRRPRGFVPVPEIQYLAYLHNAEDQLRGEAARCVLLRRAIPQRPGRAGRRVGYQKGFGGHFHNDNSVAVLRDIPGLVIAVAVPCGTRRRDVADLCRRRAGSGSASSSSRSRSTTRATCSRSPTGSGSRRL